MRGTGARLHARPRAACVHARPREVRARCNCLTENGSRGWILNGKEGCGSTLGKPQMASIYQAQEYTGSEMSLARSIQCDLLISHNGQFPSSREDGDIVAYLTQLVTSWSN